MSKLRQSKIIYKAHFLHSALDQIYFKKSIYTEDALEKMHFINSIILVSLRDIIIVLINIFNYFYFLFSKKF